MISALIPGIWDFSQSSSFSIIVYNLIRNSMSALVLLFVRRRCVQIDLLMMMCLIRSSTFLEFLRRFQYGFYVNNFYLLIIVLLDSFYKEFVLCVVLSTVAVSVPRVAIVMSCCRAASSYRPLPSLCCLSPCWPLPSFSATSCITPW